MAVPVIMPKQGQSVETCVINEWYKKVGDKVKKGDILFSYETDKASFEEESPEEGIMLAQFFEEGDEVPVLVNVAVIGNEGEKVEEFKPQDGDAKEEVQQAPEQQEEPSQTHEITVQEQAVPATSVQQGEIKISPRAKKIAQHKGVPIQNLQGTGPEGRIIERDIEHYLQSGGAVTTPLAEAVSKDTGLQAPAQGTGAGNRVRKEDLTETTGAGVTGDVEIKKLSNMRKIIAEKMHQSLQNSAQLTHHSSADARNIMNLRKKVKAEAEKGNSENITLNDMVCFAVIKALQKYPEMNAHFLGNEMRIFKNVHLGMAVNTDRGLMVPTLKNANHFSLPGLSAQLKMMATACQKGSIDPELLSSESASFTVSNLGVYGIEMFTPVLNIPQVGILGINTITHRPGNIGDGTIGFVPRIGISLTYDHRAVDGAPASQFLKEIATQIEQITINS